MDAMLQTFLADPVGTVGHLLGQGFKGAGPLVLALVVMLLAAGFWLWRRPAGKGRTNVTVRRAFSQAEGLLWSRLSGALPDHVVLMSVPLTHFITVRQAGGLGRNQRKLEALTVDFGVFRSDGTVSSVVIVEDGDSMLTRRQIKLRRKILERAAVRTVNWPLKPLPSVDMISRQLNPALIQFAAGERGSARRSIGRGSAPVLSDEALAPDTRLAASHANPDFSPHNQPRAGAAGFRSA
jgi:hypothetical protein